MVETYDLSESYRMLSGTCAVQGDGIFHHSMLHGKEAVNPLLGSHTKQIPTHDSLLDVLELVFALEDKQAMHIAIALMCDDLV